jgi:excisionase family DNA binding protein
VRPPCAERSLCSYVNWNQSVDYRPRRYSELRQGDEDMRSAFKILAAEVCQTAKHDAQHTDPVTLHPTKMTPEVPHGEHHTRAQTERADRTATASQATVLAGQRVRRSLSERSTRNQPVRDSFSNLPMTVKEAALFLGVSAQTVYLWVERKQIPHFRVMGRNIRFLKSDLKPFRAQFKQEVENGTTA